MISLQSAIASHIQQDTTSLATCWKVTLTDGTIYRFTDHDVDLLVREFNVSPVADFTYDHDSAFLASDFSGAGDMSVDGIDIHSWIDDTNISENDIYAGKWDDARVEIFAVNHQDPDGGQIPLKTGYIGNITYENKKIVLEMRGLTQRLQLITNKVYQFTCRARLFDSDCKIVKSSHLLSTGSPPVSTVNAVSSNLSFTVDETFTADQAVYGTIEWVTGNNAGLVHDIKTHTTGGLITLELPTPLTVQVGDTAEIYRGCDKTRATCRDRYSNIINFRGEPDQPLPDEILYPVRQGRGDQ